MDEDMMSYDSKKLSRRGSYTSIQSLVVNATEVLTKAT